MAFTTDILLVTRRTLLNALIGQTENVIGYTLHCVHMIRYKMVVEGLGTYVNIGDAMSGSVASEIKIN